MDVSRSRLAINQQQCREFFRCRCVICRRYSEIVHEITPRSNGERAEVLENMIVLCAAHHEWAHQRGSKVTAPVLLTARQRMLERYHAD